MFDENNKGNLIMNNKKAFTLVELMVVIAIFGIISLIAAPNIVTGLPKYRIKRAAKDITSKIRAARSEAIKTSSDATIEFDLANNRYKINEEWYPDGESNSNNVLSEYYGSGVSFGTTDNETCSFDGEKVIFNSRGILNDAGGDGEIHLTNNQQAAYKIEINSVGSIQLQQWMGSEWQ